MALAVGATALAVAGGVAACITAPPPDLPELPQRGPRIVQDAVRPPANAYLTALPADGIFNVPVEVTDPTRTIDGRAFVDFYPGSNNMGRNATGFAFDKSVPPTLDGGTTLVSFMLPSFELGDLTACHIIQFFVADSFSDQSGHTAGDSLGADSVTWFYAPNGPSGCSEYDAGDGAFPSDAPFDGILQTPDSVGPL